MMENGGGGLWCGLHTIKYTKRRCQKKTTTLFYSFFLCQLWWLPVSLQTALPSHSVVAGRAHSRVLRRRVLGAPRVLLRLLLLMVLQHRQRLVNLVHQRALIRQQHQQFRVVHLQKHSGNLTRQSGFDHLNLREQPLSDHPLLLRRFRLLQHLRSQRVHLQHRSRGLAGCPSRAQLTHRVLSRGHTRLVRLRRHVAHQCLRRSQSRRARNGRGSGINRGTVRSTRHALRGLTLLVLSHRLRPLVRSLLDGVTHLSHGAGRRRELLLLHRLCGEDLSLRRVVHRRLLLQRQLPLLRRHLLSQDLLLLQLLLL